MRADDITPTLVASLVAEQFPQWADLPVSAVSLDGWDNRTFRLGGELTVRLPSHDWYVAQVDKEHTWLPVLRRSLPLPIPEPVARGRATAAFPRPWSIYRWIDGEPAALDRVADLSAFAADLAGFLRALQNVDAAGGPVAGAHNFHRGSPLSVYAADVRESLAVLRDRVDAAAVERVWQRAVSRPWQGAPVWLHGDVTPSNILVRDGRIHAVIDFGCCAVGDPACDLTIAWTFLDDQARAVFRKAPSVDDATWDRGRAWALWKALISVVDDERRVGVGDGADTAQRMGWSRTAAEVIARALEE